MCTKYIYKHQSVKQTPPGRDNTKTKHLLYFSNRTHFLGSTSLSSTVVLSRSGCIPPWGWSCMLVSGYRCVKNVARRDITVTNLRRFRLDPLLNVSPVDGVNKCLSLPGFKEVFVTFVSKCPTYLLLALFPDYYYLHYLICKYGGGGLGDLVTVHVQINWG